MNRFPYGARHFFAEPDDPTQYPLEDSEVDKEGQRVEAVFRENQELLLKPLWEVDGLLDSEKQWGYFICSLMGTAQRSSLKALHYARDGRKKATAIKQQITQAVVNIVQLVSRLETLGDEHEETYFPSSARNPMALLGVAAFIQNELSSEGVCTYQDDLEGKMQSLINGTSREAIPDFLGLLLAFEFQLTYEEKNQNHFDSLSFSRNNSPANFIREFTDSLKRGIEAGNFPNKLRTLSFRSIETFASVLFPHTIIKASNYIDADWNPIKSKASQ